MISAHGHWHLGAYAKVVEDRNGHNQDNSPRTSDLGCGCESGAGDFDRMTRLKGGRDTHCADVAAAGGRQKFLGFLDSPEV